MVEGKRQEASRSRGESRQEAELESVDFSIENCGSQKEQGSEAWEPGFDVRAGSILITGARARGAHVGWGRGSQGSRECSPAGPVSPVVWEVVLPVGREEWKRRGGAQGRPSSRQHGGSCPGRAVALRGPTLCGWGWFIL